MSDRDLNWIRVGVVVDTVMDVIRELGLGGHHEGILADRT